MESQIWKVQTEKIGTLEAFRSERYGIISHE